MINFIEKMEQCVLIIGDCLKQIGGIFLRLLTKVIESIIIEVLGKVFWVYRMICIHDICTKYLIYFMLQTTL